MAVLRFGAAAALGVAFGVGAYTFLYAKGGSYMTNDPAACANCHVMQGQFDAWQKSSHHSVAVCNDCHVPMDSFFGKWWVKSTNGWHHSSAFTTGDYPDTIRAKERSREVVESQCRRCHADIAETVDGHGAGVRACVPCHDSVGHLR
jgi:cytochrome c nitrite reductase small subunit